MFPDVASAPGSPAATPQGMSSLRSTDFGSPPWSYREVQATPAGEMNRGIVFRWEWGNPSGEAALPFATRMCIGPGPGPDEEIRIGLTKDFRRPDRPAPPVSGGGVTRPGLFPFSRSRLPVLASGLFLRVGSNGTAGWHAGGVWRRLRRRENALVDEPPAEGDAVVEMACIPCVLSEPSAGRPCRISRREYSTVVRREGTCNPRVACHNDSCR
jgi:hypothetical protein